MVLRLSFVTLICCCTAGILSSSSDDNNPKPPEVNGSTKASDKHALEFIGTPFLFQPIVVRFVNSQIENFSRLTYFDLESRPLAVLPGRESIEWRRIATKSGPDNVNIEFGCEWLTATGLYRIKARKENQTIDSPVVKLSGPRKEDSPKLQLKEDSIFPSCQHDFDLSWQLPNCTTERKAAADTFRIRLSAVQADGMEVYMGELRPALDMPSRIETIPCAQFDIIYVEFCFELVSLQPYSHQLDLWDRKCLSTEPALSIDGGWTQWSEWSECSRSCSSGRKKRRRECTNPKPQRGRFCQGRMVESESCNHQKCPVITTSIPSPRYNASQRNCECGCALYDQSGSVYATSGHIQCRNQSSIEWEVPSKYLARLRLTFIGRLVGKERLKVVDESGQEMFGLSSKTIKDIPTVTLFPLETLTTIEFIPDPDMTSKDTGLIIDYEIIPAPQPSADGDEYSALIGSRFVECKSKKCHAVMTILSLLVCLVTIMILVAVPPLMCSFITRRRMRTRKHRTNKLLESMRAESDMVRSGGTDSTQISSSNHGVSKPPMPPREFNGTLPLDPSHQLNIHHPSRRSIGVQQSAQTTPRQLRSALETPCPTASIDLEYDYFDPIMPGSILRPIENVDIDIDGIIESETSGWLNEFPSLIDGKT